MTASDPFRPVDFLALRLPTLCEVLGLTMAILSDAQTFHVDLFGRFAVLTVVIFAPVLWIASDSISTLLVAFAFIVIAEVGMYLLCTVVVSRDGIMLNRANKAQWQDVTGAKRVSFFGLPYLKVERRKGFKLWIPLYLRKPKEFRLALAAKAPVGNPLREYAESDPS